MRLIVAARIVLLSLVLTFATGGTATAPVTSPQLLLWNPTNARSDGIDRNNYLVVKPYFALSYNEATGCPNWVSWRLAKEDLGEAPRKRKFSIDMTLPAGFKQVTHADYAGGGFDRGHMCPHGDRAATRDMSYATFVMTNIVPQAPNVNQKAWNQFERYCRTLVATGARLYVVAGPAGKGGWGTQGFRTTLAKGRVTVPAACWKVVVVLPEGVPDGLAGIDARTRVIAVMMPNANAVDFDWAPYRTSVAEIEQATGLTFFDALPPDVAEALQTKVDLETLPGPIPPYRGATTMPSPTTEESDGD